jgi:flagellin-like hook-associated protein FlgL
MMVVNRISALRNYVHKSNEIFPVSKVKKPTADSFADVLNSTRMASHARGIHAARENMQDALALSQFLESSLAKMHEMSLRLQELSIQYNDSTLTASEKSIIEKESTELIREMKMLMENINFGGLRIFERDKYVSTDMAKEIMTKVKYDLLSNPNLQMLSHNLDDQRNHICELINL